MCNYIEKSAAIDTNYRDKFIPDHKLYQNYV